jgi:hypothetical protein
MKHTVDDLLETVHLHYPRRIPSYDPRYRRSEEHLRLSAARRRAGAEAEPWRAMLRRLTAHFPDHEVQNRSLHLPTGEHDACYAGSLHLPASAPGEEPHWLGFFVSFLVPYYILYSSRFVDDPEATEARRLASEERARSPDKTVNVRLGDMVLKMPADDLAPELEADLGKLHKRSCEADPEALARAQSAAERPCRRQDVRFDLSPDEQPCAAWIAHEIEATLRCERMPPEVGNVIVGDVSTDSRLFWEARIYDCLMSDHW